MKSEKSRVQKLKVYICNTSNLHECVICLKESSSEFAKRKEKKKTTCSYTHTVRERKKSASASPFAKCKRVPKCKLYLKVKCSLI